LSEALKYALLATDVLRHDLTSVVPVVNKYTTGTSWYRKGSKATDMYGTLAMQCPWMKVYAENCTHARVVRIMWIVCTLYTSERKEVYSRQQRPHSSRRQGKPVTWRRELVNDSMKKGGEGGNPLKLWKA
jgi:hypothetical protein